MGGATKTGSCEFMAPKVVTACATMLPKVNFFQEDGFRSDWEDQETEHASDYSFLFLAKLSIYWNYQKNNYFCYQVFVSKDSHRTYIWTSSKEKK